ncbi:DUF2169 family type VI secretion system accessory protein [Myxococcus xanthus]|uniref:DUF2169 family type VI secretion system accessory protein n=1 Tax=Myxococcus xanthus TaxID=34 RepID=UPI000347431C|nr:DUF2169 domain-containing protein [Myxococcus xanthus]QVW70467.1 DUF2169 domain-containing protein [Myxococcus xanthus DZ2]QZZ49338.1 hypothetical protein MyxoNM_09015 [Myxococcus xanthus]UEO03405.1 DUF2169 domain-containing protein [Myxococcus xanthus DZ2]UYI16423.1 DUF2169 domain-containing protein [Myxococcus xanthus]UYI23785.1 DUF2169 domain-containing protein [Myxococcus xanthus]
MPALENFTPFAATDFLSLTKESEESLVLVVAGSFVLPPAGRATDAPLQVCEEQPEPVTTDTYWGEPAKSSLRYESQSAYTRPGTDVLLHGQAWAPRGRKLMRTQVTVRVGTLEKRASVSGTRVWYRGLMGLSASDALPFESVPLRYEYAFGGTTASGYEARNPVGRGFYASAKEALEKPLPSIEAPEALVRGWTDRPKPCGFGPVARHWQPRLGWAGTYDAAWVEKRAPLWPRDFDERFFHAAPDGLRASTHLQGGEPVVLEGVSPDGPLAFPLPTYRLLARCTFSGRRETRRMALDTVLLEPEERRLVLAWRATFPAHRQLASHEVSTVRLLLPGEDAP